MTRGPWHTAALLVSLFASTASAQEETSAPPRSLAERLSQFRMSWSGSEDQQQPAPRANQANSNRSSISRSRQTGGLPRVNSRSLLPDDLNAGQGNAPAPPRVASLPDRYQRDSSGSTATTPSNTRTPARPGPVTAVRRSPFQSPKHEFDAAELRRDLVATNAPSAGTSASSEKQPEADPSAPAAIVSSPASQSTIRDRNSATETAATPATPMTKIEAVRKSMEVASPIVINSQSPRPTAPADRVTAPQSGTASVEQSFETSQADLRNLFQKSSEVSTSPNPTAMPTPSDVLMSLKLPQIASQVSGPRQIVIGREATYKVLIANRGELAADQLSTRVTVPAWAELKNVTVSNGTLDRQDSGNELSWQIAKLDAEKYETLEVILVAKESRPIELGVDWTHAPVDSRTVVEVREPKLAITVTGPDEVLFGKPQLYQLTLSNPGTAAVEELTIELLPPGGDPSKVSRHPFGGLAAGETKTAEVELTAREAGKLFVKANASAAGGLTAAAEKEILCRKPELKVDWRGPERKYAGTQATYYLRVVNPGTATVEGVAVQVDLPPNFEVIEANGASAAQKGQRSLAWKLNSLQPGDERYLELKGTLNQQGVNEFKMTASSQDGIVKHAASMSTSVEALADLKLQVSDPTGPIAVGEEAIYEIRVNNRGASDAKQVTVAALFSEGIEPQSAEGAGHSIADGRVAFHTIEKLPAGGEMTLRVRARAVAAGMHLFRAEVVCSDLEIKLAAEETTRFYTDDAAPTRTADETSGVAPASTGSRYSQ